MYVSQYSNLGKVYQKKTANGCNLTTRTIASTTSTVTISLTELLTAAGIINNHKHTIILSLDILSIVLAHGGCSLNSATCKNLKTNQATPFTYVSQAGNMYVTSPEYKCYPGPYDATEFNKSLFQIEGKYSLSTSSGYQIIKASMEVEYIPC